ncbi:MAG TPA: efflux RND transporter periplasmic adaptor subunit [Isosphaeraceae bacterium]|jgi:HlyD family secretion protein|nr:efflux RND transporter periplasmic adaptor subunit [Isosphaeraceae bacterium]
MKKLLFLMVVLWAGGIAAFWYWNDSKGQPVGFRTLKLRRGDLLATIEATGTIEPEEVVDVGAQVAGEIQSFGEDPADPSRPIGHGAEVEPGTVLARLDGAIYRARVAQAEASLSRAEAEAEQAGTKLRQTERDWNRSKQLATRGGIVSQQDRDASQASYEAAQAASEVAKSAIAVARANLEEARINLARTTITAPVKGVILDRRANLGQSVVAGAMAPSLFLIARDLARMEIWASVNENDVGAIKVGQPVRFTVGTFPGETFRGRVRQVRLNASMAQGVVSYTVVVRFENTNHKLLPYLTARLKFEVDRRDAVLLAPNAALRWRPRPDLVVPEARAALDEPRDVAAGTGDGRRPGLVWVRQGDLVRPIPVTVGLTDGLRTEVAAVPGLEDGDEVVVGLAPKSEADATATPFLPQIKNDKAAKPKSKK